MLLFYEDKDEDINGYGLFATPLMTFNYGDISEDELSTCNRYLNNVIPNRYNFVTKENYILDKDLPSFKKFFDKCIKKYVEKVIIGEDYYKDTFDINFKITQSWINLSVPGSLGHHEHRHSNSFISGVFYIDVDASCDQISFINSFLADRDLVIGKCKTNCFNSDEWDYPVKNGHLVLFPSYQYHFVKPLKGNKNRISLAFNVMPCGTLGQAHDLNELRIQDDK
tara:strand:- start:35 stop:706 length:672 start_codon:yes stop_codon:yes gene_type:complete